MHSLVQLFNTRSSAKHKQQKKGNIDVKDNIINWLINDIFTSVCVQWMHQIENKYFQTICSAVGTGQCLTKSLSLFQFEFPNNLYFIILHCFRFDWAQMANQRSFKCCSEVLDRLIDTYFWTLKVKWRTYIYTWCSWCRFRGLGVMKREANNSNKHNCAYSSSVEGR